jgi:hypothetical protein
VGNSASAAVQGAVKYSERLYLPWWSWPLPLLGAGLIGAEINTSYTSVAVWLPYVVLLPLMAVYLLSLGRSRVRVTGGEEPELWIDSAHLPLRYVGEVEIIDRDRKRKALGPEGDPAAFAVHRGWVGPVVRVRLNDPSDPTPYWLFSTRKPEKVAALLRGEA